MTTLDRPEFDPNDLGTRYRVYKRLCDISHQSPYFGFSLIYQLCYPDDKLQELIENDFRRSQVMKLLEFYCQGKWVIAEDSAGFIQFKVSFPLNV
jgi:type II secretory ATPase GspE/PulE/Tfp pilus assembly ATPase PilB-like protein